MSEHKQDTAPVEEPQPAEVKPSLPDLWHLHPELQDERIIEASGIAWIKVMHAFWGWPVLQEEFDAVLAAINQLTGGSYRQEDIAGVWIAPIGRAGL